MTDTTVQATDRTEAPRQGGTVLDVRGLRKIYNEGKPTAKMAIDDVTFSVDKGEFVCIVGPSGAGKTTLLRCISGLAQPSAGELSFEGKPLTSVPEQLGLVFQDYSRSLYPWFTNAKNVGLPLAARGVPKAERTARISEVLGSVGLAQVEKQYPWQLSGGMQQRVAIARALSYRPDLLLMDEPFASVDAQTRFDLEDLVLRVRSELGITVVLVTHDIDEAIYLADRIVVLSGSPSRVREVVEVPFGGDRDQVVTRSSDEFLELRRHLLDLVMPHAASEG
ncbi:ABC transporter ATP-binding protein [Microbacterium pseudoresistens]|uniref:NitT/TauT family transport system ATP-binding protein n=1 Tax=Microbacterium pseudoresistens TaxID=640634 RepID=A0A7Y9EVZ2_9MICO|nr:ABC transporter ATP-binding protein [Microbacterium pseudoresistens]NYD54918.1 NitT/TauT family transport system ATP-binding protein [Microbacterium pseudoresistens]